MSQETFVAGDMVQFNVGKEDGPVFFGTVTRINRDGTPMIQPERPGHIPNGVRFHNIKKATRGPEQNARRVR